MEDFGDEETLGRTGWKVLADAQLDLELAAEVGRVRRSFDEGLHPGHVLVVQDDRNPLHRLHFQALDLLADQSKDLGVQVLHVLNVGHHD